MAARIKSWRTLVSPVPRVTLRRARPGRSSMHQNHPLSHADALAIVAALQAELERTHPRAAIAVVDAPGELLAFLRTDGCRLPATTIFP